MAGAEDRAPQGCDRSADSGAEIGRERAPRAPPAPTHLGTKAINPGGLGAKPPALPASSSFRGVHKTFDRTGHRSALDLDQRDGEPPQWGVFRKSTIENQPQAGSFHLRHEPQIFVPRVLTPEFCPAEIVGWTGWASRRRETCARTWLHSTATHSYCIIRHYESQDKSTSVRAYKMSLPESKCGADLQNRAALP